MSQDLNTSAHLIVLQHLGRWVTGQEPLGLIPHLNAPMGVRIQVVAWPTMALATLLQPLMGTFAALNLGQAALLGAAGPMMVAALRRMGLGRWASLTGGVAWATSPLFLTFTANGQFENCVGFEMALTLWGVARGSWAGALALLLSTLLMGFSSPYQVVPQVLLLFATLAWVRPRRAWALSLAAIVGYLPPFLYYLAELPFDAPFMGPGPNLSITPVLAADLFQPLALADAKGTASWSFTARRILGTFFDFDARGASLRDSYRMHYAYLGLVLGLLGAAGFALNPRRRWTWAALTAFGLTFVAAKGHSYIVGNLVWPWTWTRYLPGFDKMGMTYRFATGLGFSLSVGAALLVESVTAWRRRGGLLVASLALPLLLLDAFFGGPYKLPHPSFTPRLAGGYAALIEDPTNQGIVMDLPVVDWDDPELYPFLPPVMGAMHGRRMTYRPVNMMLRRIQGTPIVQAVYHGDSLDAEGIARSLEQFRSEGITYMVVHTGALRPRTWPFTFFILENHLGPPDAEGDGVIAWRLRGD
jgi:hypothetical protein